MFIGTLHDNTSGLASLNSTSKIYAKVNNLILKKSHSHHSLIVSLMVKALATPSTTSKL